MTTSEVREDAHELFVPGRLCLFGEHSDWSGGYRQFNRDITIGATLVMGTNQGLHARAWRGSELEFRATTAAGERVGPFRCAMDRAALWRAAQEGGFFSYVCGVAWVVLTNHVVGGIVVDQHTTTLPLRKGLSSSAAVCVLVARAFNRAYNLRLSTRGEMEVAYQGERCTPSMCGRMDQACAYGSQPTLLTYDGDRLEVEPVRIRPTRGGDDGGPPEPIIIRLIIVDLGQVKDTPLMLASLQASFPGPATDDVGRGVHRWLGEVNRDLVGRAFEAVQGGDSATLGALMDEAMGNFDAYGLPTCPSQFEAPTLHRVLADATLRRFTYGGKSIGCGGEGSCQFVARSEEARQAALAYIRTTLGMWCCAIDLGAAKKGVTKAVIPAAGYHGALFPASHVTPSPLWPVVDDRDGLVKSALMLTIEELVDRAGIEDVIVVIQPGDVAAYERALLRTPLDPRNAHRLAKNCSAYEATAKRLGTHVTLATQPVQDGLGHALLCGRPALYADPPPADGGGGGGGGFPDEPVLVVLGDHLYREAPTATLSCAQQLIQAYLDEPASSYVAVQSLPADDEARAFGVLTGTWRHSSASAAADILCVDAVVEKPANPRDYADAQGQVHTCFGMYVVRPTVFDYLDDDVKANRRDANGAFDLSSALNKLANEQNLRAVRIDGTRFDFGSALSFANTWSHFATAKTTRNHHHHHQQQQHGEHPPPTTSAPPTPPPSS